MKKILISLSIIGAVAAIATGVTIALFNDTETSTGNIFVAGTMDLKVDHVRQTYNGVDCNTCSVLLISDPTNMVVAKNGGSVSPYPAVYVGSTNPPGFIHEAWTAQNDPALVAANAEWIWESDPTQQADTQVNVTYTFEKTFQWWGPIVGSDLSMAVGHDNTVDIYLNNVLIGSGTDPQGYKIDHMLHVPSAVITANVLQGVNVLRFVVTNDALLNPPGTPFNNPGGLIYKFEIDGNCGDIWFKEHCMLWGEKDMTGQETFFNFDDVKPGDWGTNIISLHVFDNAAYSCLLVTNPVDNENVCIDSEVGDTTCTSAPTDGELSQFLSAVLWEDDSPKNNAYDAGETILYGPGALLKNIKTMTRLPLTATSTANIGLAWCLGTQTVDPIGGVISCSGVGNQDISQTDSFLASLTAYAEQQRNNENFSCASVILP